jgi:hypothetical protein
LSHCSLFKSDFKSDSNACQFIFSAVTVLQPSKKPENAKKCHFRQKLASLAVVQMPKIQPTSFRIPSRHLVFLELLAHQNKTNRTQELCKILDDAIAPDVILDPGNQFQSNQLGWIADCFVN